MKLLSPKDVKNALREEESALQIKTKDTFQALREEEKKINDLRARFAREESELQKELSEQKNLQAEIIKGLLEEVSVLEEERDALFASADMKRLEEREKSVSFKESTLVERDAMYASWRKELEERDRMVMEQIIQLNIQFAEVEDMKRMLEQKEKTIWQRDAVSESLSQEVEKREAAFNKREQDLLEQFTLWKKAQEAIEAANVEQERAFQREKKKIAEQKIAVTDGYKSLMKAREEILGRKT